MNACISHLVRHFSIETAQNKTSERDQTLTFDSELGECHTSSTAYTRFQWKILIKQSVLIVLSSCTTTFTFALLLRVDVSNNNKRTFDYFSNFNSCPIYYYLSRDEQISYCKNTKPRTNVSVRRIAPSLGWCRNWPLRRRTSCTISNSSDSSSRSCNNRASDGIGSSKHQQEK